jgi:CHAD domain-containing protein
MNMKEFAHERIEALLARFASQARRAAENPDEEAVHDLRVSIRRLSGGLRAFSQFFPGKSWKQVRRELSPLMDAAAGVRDRDISLDLCKKAGLEEGAGIVARFTEDRSTAAGALQNALREWNKRHALQQWKGALEL